MTLSWPPEKNHEKIQATQHPSEKGSYQRVYQAKTHMTKATAHQQETSLQGAQIYLTPEQQPLICPPATSSTIMNLKLHDLSWFQKSGSV